MRVCVYVCICMTMYLVVVFCVFLCLYTHVVCEHVFQKYRINSLFVLGTPSGFDTNIISV